MCFLILPGFHCTSWMVWGLGYCKSWKPIRAVFLDPIFGASVGLSKQVSHRGNRVTTRLKEVIGIVTKKSSGDPTMGHPLLAPLEIHTKQHELAPMSLGRLVKECRTLTPKP